MGDLESWKLDSVTIPSQSREISTLKALSALSFLPHDIKHLVNELCTLSIVCGTRVRFATSYRGMKTRTSFGPVVTGATLAKDKIVRSEEGTKRSGADRVHSTRLKIDQDGTGNILIRPDFIIVDINSFKLEVVGSLVLTVPFDAMFVGHGFPELGAY